MIDIHSHILPNVDDGSESLEMSIDMAKVYIENGINTVIATPHYMEGSIVSSSNKNKEVLEELRKLLFKEGLDFDIYLGNEFYISTNIIKDIEDGKVCTLNGTRYILIELPMNDIPLYVDDVIYELLLKGFIPIIAHPERNLKIVKDPNILYNYIKKGALTQLNLPSLEGRYGSSVKSTAEILLDSNMVHFVGTDAHTNRLRSPNVKKALEILKSIVGSDDFEDLTYNNARLLLDNKIINIKTPKKYQNSKRKLWPLNIFNKKFNKIV